MTISAHFFGNYINIFHKTEIQMVILSCLRSPNLNWNKNYDKKYKTQKTQKMKISVFVQNRKKKRNGNIFILGHQFSTNDK